MIEVNKENMRKWVDALRSGEYGQGRESLRQDDAYCCLGVACELSGLGEWETLAHGKGRYVTPAAVSHNYLPSPVREWLGIDDHNPQVVIPGGGTEYVAELNDQERWTFAQIADAVEETFLS